MPAVTSPAAITVSVVSHGQNALVNGFLEDMARYCGDRIALVVTQNIPDPVALALAGLPCPVEVLHNQHRKGFGENHNAAFSRCRSGHFCVANPDIRLRADPFARLLESMESERAAAVGPLVRNPAGEIEDSARRFPTAGSLFRKLVHERRAPEYRIDQGAQRVDWVAGMFLLVRSEAFRRVAGFDERYFLYYEDVDLCRRLGAQVGPVVYEPRVEVIHDARRASRRELRLALRHVTSALRFLASPR
jgi:N-acetylglucosaminyl-diphospho-decaprenol L-rhamnosyltransferase